MMTADPEPRPAAADIRARLVCWQRSRNYVAIGNLGEHEPRRRCWTLNDPVNGFHLDVLPAIPDLDCLPTGILLTDKELFHWQHSDPIGYARWFRKRSQELQNKVITAAAQRGVDIEDVPIWEFRTTLQRVVRFSSGTACSISPMTRTIALRRFSSPH